jgi:hypothetical protein
MILFENLIASDMPDVQSANNQRYELLKKCPGQ